MCVLAMKQQQALTPFEGLESFKGYTEEDTIQYADCLFNVEQNEESNVKFIPKKYIPETLENIAYLRWCKDRIEFLYNYAKQYVTDYVEEEKGVKVFEGKFSVATKKGYDYSVFETWLSYKEEEKAVSEGRKEFEKVCREGGFFAGEKIEKLGFVTEKELRFKIEK